MLELCIGSLTDQYGVVHLEYIEWAGRKSGWIGFRGDVEMCNTYGNIIIINIVPFERYMVPAFDCIVFNVSYSLYIANSLPPRGQDERRRQMQKLHKRPKSSNFEEIPSPCHVHYDNTILIHYQSSY